MSNYIYVYMNRSYKQNITILNTVNPINTKRVPYEINLYFKAINVKLEKKHFGTFFCVCLIESTLTEHLSFAIILKKIF